MVASALGRGPRVLVLVLVLVLAALPSSVENEHEYENAPEAGHPRTGR